MYSEKHNYIIKKWKKNIIEYWKNNQEIDNYYRHHYLFGDLYNSDNKFKKMWDLTPKISADGPHILQNLAHINIFKVSDKVKNHIDKIKSPIYKLSYKDFINFLFYYNFEYLLNKI